MLNGIDHLVVIVPDLDVARKNYTALGFTVIPGGKHPIGSRNALISFADGSYIELIAFTVEESPHPWYALLKKGGGLIDFCAQAEDLEAELASFRKAGAVMSQPIPLSRERPDGYTLRWSLSIPQPPWSGVIPFLIQDETPREERVPQNTEHPNGATGIGALAIAVEDLDGLRCFYETALGQRGTSFKSKELGAIGFSFQIGRQALTLIASREAGGPIATWLRERGSSPYSAAINASSGPVQVLDIGKTLNANLSLGRIVRPRRSSSAD